MLKKRNIVLILISILFLAGCNNNGGQTTEAPPSTENVNTENLESTNESSEKVDNTLEYTVVVDSIDNNGIICYPYEDTSDLWNVDEKFYINSKDAAIFKNGKTSIYDIVYFYDGLVITFDGKFDTKSNYTVFVPNEGTKININLIDELKSLDVDKEDDRDETPIEIIDKDNNKADIEFLGMFCKFKYPAKYNDVIEIVNLQDWRTGNYYVEAYYIYNNNGKNQKIKLFNINRNKITDYKSKFTNEVNYTTGFILHESDNYIYEVSCHQGSNYINEKQEIIDYIRETVTIIE